MKGVTFVVHPAPEEGYTAHAVGYPIFTQGQTLDELRHNIREATECHFDEGDQPLVIRLIQAAS